MKLAFVLEYCLGHTTHADNLKRVLANDQRIIPTYIDLPFDNTPGWWSGLPGVRSNWSIRASLGARVRLKPHVGRIDGALFHTQVTSLFSSRIMNRVPSVISLDATPMQYDRLGAFYGHTPSGNDQLETLKKNLNVRAFSAAKRLVTWSQWAKDSLSVDYGVAQEKVSVIPPGIDTALWQFDRSRVDGTINVLFVGADFRRKGGDTLIDAFARLPPTMNVKLDIVTTAVNLGELPRNVAVHRGVIPNSPHLRQLFRSANIFAFPSRADCLPLAVMEALAAGLPVITTDVGALSEAVKDEYSGLVVPADNPEALTAAIERLVCSSEMRSRMSANARKEAVLRFDANTNYSALIECVKSVTEEKCTSKNR